MSVTAFSPEENPDPDAHDGGWLPVWLELTPGGRLRNYGYDEYASKFALTYYHHATGTARAFGYCGA